MTIPVAVRQAGDAARRAKNRTLRWNPPALDSPVHPLSSAPPCQLAAVLGQAGARAVELVENLQNFTAEEEIEYQTLDHADVLQVFGSETFEYVVTFGAPEKGLAMEEHRNPIHGSSGTAAGLDIGLPELALIFLPEMQGDYDMVCAGAGEWENQPAWVIQFRQRRDRPSRTFSFRVGHSVYSAGLRGRAWIDVHSGEVLHLETGLMESVPAVNMRQWYLSIGYAPVQFQSRPVTVWLPSVVNGYLEYGKLRTIVYHTFSKYLLFSVQTEEKIAKPKAP